MRRVRRTSYALVFAAALTFLITAEIEALAQQAEIAGIEKVYLRPAPGTDQTPLGVLNAGDRVNILDIEGLWTKVETADGKIGYVYHRYVVPLAEGGIPAVAAPRPVVPSAPAVAAVPAPARIVPTPLPAVPLPVPTTPEAAKDAVSAELAGLRAELSELKERVQKRAVETGEAPERSVTVSPLDARPAPSPAAPASEQGMGVVAVAFVFLVIGWVLGAAFNRRRSKSQRHRLRF